MDDTTGNPGLETPTGETQATDTEHDDVDLIAEMSDEEASTADNEPQKEAEPAPRKLRVKIDGQEIDVDEEEAAKGYQRQADYSRNMQKVQAEMAQATQMRESYQQRLEQYIPEQEAKLQRLHQELETLAIEDPAAWVAKQQEFNTELSRYQNAHGEREQLKQEQTRQEQMSSHKRLQDSEVALIQSIPEWKNPETRKAEAPAVAKFLREKVGLTESDLAAVNNGVFGHFPIVLAQKAMKFDALMAKVNARKAGKAEETDAPAPVTQIRTSGGAAKAPDSMNSKEFAAWRKKQIAQRN
jgi:hypothetical protein